MKIKAIKFDEAVKRISFIKGITKSRAKKFLTDKGAIEYDDVFIILDSEMNLGIKIHNISDPKEIEIDFKY